MTTLDDVRKYVMNHAAPKLLVNNLQISYTGQAILVYLESCGGTAITRDIVNNVLHDINGRPVEEATVTSCLRDLLAKGYLVKKMKVAKIPYERDGSGHMRRMCIAHWTRLDYVD